MSAAAPAPAAAPRRPALPAAVAALVAKHPDLDDLAFNAFAALQRAEALVVAEWDEVDRLLGVAPAPPPPAAAGAGAPAAPAVSRADTIYLCSMERPYNSWAQMWLSREEVPAWVPAERLLRLSDLGVSPLLADKFHQLLTHFYDVQERQERTEQRMAELVPRDDETPEEFTERETSLQEYLDMVNVEVAHVEEQIGPFRPVVDLGARLFDTAYHRSLAWQRRHHLVAAFDTPPPAAAAAEVFEGDYPLHDPEWLEYLDALLAGIEAGAAAPNPVPSADALIEDVLAFVRARSAPAPRRDLATEVLNFTAAHFTAVYEERLQTEFQAIALACEAC
jgi:hypothetical protein